MFLTIQLVVMLAVFAVFPQSRVNCYYARDTETFKRNDYEELAQPMTEFGDYRDDPVRAALEDNANRNMALYGKSNRVKKSDYLAVLRASRNERLSRLMKEREFDQAVLGIQKYNAEGDLEEFNRKIAYSENLKSAVSS